MHSRVTLELIIKIYIYTRHSRVARQIYWVTHELHARCEQICRATRELHASTEKFVEPFASCTQAHHLTRCTCEVCQATREVFMALLFNVCIITSSNNSLNVSNFTKYQHKHHTFTIPTITYHRYMNYVHGIGNGRGVPYI